jgi:hypothetical protein
MPYGNVKETLRIFLILAMYFLSDYVILDIGNPKMAE